MDISIHLAEIKAHSCDDAVSGVEFPKADVLEAVADQHLLALRLAEGEVVDGVVGDLLEEDVLGVEDEDYLSLHFVGAQEEDVL